MSAAPTFAKLKLNLQKRASGIAFNAAWRRGQKLRRRLEEISQDFFKELTTVGVGVEAPPSLGSYTPYWEPLSTSWIERKGFDDFYFDTGALDRALRRKSTVGTFGLPQVFLEVDGKQIKITAGTPAKKYSSVKIPRLSFLLVPFPKAVDAPLVEEVVAPYGTITFFKLVNPNGHSFRPLITPFLQWYIHVKIKKALSK